MEHRLKAPKCHWRTTIRPEANQVSTFFMKNLVPFLLVFSLTLPSMGQETTILSEAETMKRLIRWMRDLCELVEEARDFSPSFRTHFPEFATEFQELFLDEYLNAVCEGLR